MFGESKLGDSEQELFGQAQVAQKFPGVGELQPSLESPSLESLSLKSPDRSPQGCGRPVY